MERCARMRAIACARTEENAGRWGKAGGNAAVERCGEGSGVR